MKDKYNMEAYENAMMILAIAGIVIWLLFAPKTPLPDNCYTTPSVDIGGPGVECD